MIALTIYISVASGFCSVAYGAYLVWFRTKAKNNFLGQLHISLNRYYSDDELKKIVDDIKTNHKADVYTMKKLTEMYVDALTELPEKERDVICNALWQPSIKGRENFIMHTVLELTPHCR